MVRKRHQTLQPENIFDLISLRLKGQLRSQRWRPIRLGQVDWDTGSLVLLPERPLQQRPSLGEFCDKAEVFFGVIGVAMEGYSRLVLRSNSRCVPKIGDLR